MGVFPGASPSLIRLSLWQTWIIIIHQQKVIILSNSFPLKFWDVISLYKNHLTNQFLLAIFILIKSLYYYYPVICHLTFFLHSYIHLYIELKIYLHFRHVHNILVPCIGTRSKMLFHYSYIAITLTEFYTLQWHRVESIRVYKNTRNAWKWFLKLINNSPR